MAKDFSIEGYPSLVFLSPEGKVVHKALGLHTVNGLIAEGEKVVDPQSAAAKASAATVFQSAIVPLLRTYPAFTSIEAAITSQEHRLEPFLWQDLIEYYNMGMVAGNTSSSLYAAVTHYQANYKDTLSNETLNSAAFAIFNYSDQKRELKAALKWVSTVIAKDSNAGYLDTYANLLYKLGNKQQAIAMEERAVAGAQGQEVFVATLNKMKADLPTWNHWFHGSEMSDPKTTGFSGMWKLDSTLSDLGDMQALQALPLSMVITQGVNSILLERNFNGTVSKDSLLYDGAPLKVHIQDVDVVRRLTWSGDRKIFTVYSEYKVKRNNEPEWGYSRTETYSMIDKGRKVLLVRVTVTPDRVTSVRGVFGR